MNILSGRLGIYLVGGAAIFIILFGIRASASIITPILLAVVITITILPVPSLLTNRGMPGWLALVLSILLVIVLLGLVIVTVFFSITRLSTDLPMYLASASQQVSADLSATQNPETGIQVEQMTQTIGPIVQGMVGNMVNLLVQFGLALVIFFFMISAALSLPVPSRLGLDPNAPMIGRISSLTESIRKYMSVLTRINFLVGMGNTIFLLFLGVDYALLWGLLAWFMGYIPSIGFMIALIPPVLLAYAQYGLQTALIVLVGYILINGGVQNFIQPKLMGKNLKISPVIVFLGLFIWGFLLGGIGAILAVPMTMLMLLIMENFEGTRPLVILMRYTGDDDSGEKREARRHLNNLLGKVKGSLSPDGTVKDIRDEP